MSKKIAIAIVVAIMLMLGFVVLASNINFDKKSIGEVKFEYKP